MKKTIIKKSKNNLWEIQWVENNKVISSDAYHASLTETVRWLASEYNEKPDEIINIKETDWNEYTVNEIDFLIKRGCISEKDIIHYYNNIQWRDKV